MSYSYVADNLKDVHQKVEVSISKAKQPRRVTLVAVSKLHSKEAILEAYKAGQRIFGENYVQELYDKATDPDILANCPDIQWHLVGHLQSNKVNKLLSVFNLTVVETVDSISIAQTLDKAVAKSSDKITVPLKVMVQINTSGEDNKSGVNPDTFIELVEFVRNSCSHLEFIGLMTIGAYGYDPSNGPNPDFLKLIECRDTLCQKLGLDYEKVEVSMGMSTDFEQAVELGSTMIRVGTTIFGNRPSKA